MIQLILTVLTSCFQFKKGVSGQLTKLKNFVKMWFGVLVCVILPIAVYVVDIIITTKVIESKGYKHAMVHWQDDTNKNNKPIPKMNTFGFDDYTLKETWFFEVFLIGIYWTRPKNVLSISYWSSRNNTRSALWKRTLN